MVNSNPPIDFDQAKEIGLYHLFAMDGHLLVVAFDVRYEFGEHTKLMGML